MKTIAFSAFALALMTAMPAYAQSAFVMVIGEAPRASEKRAAVPVTQEARVERAVNTACVRPTISDVSRLMAYRECAQQVRAELASAQRAPEQFAAR